MEINGTTIYKAQAFLSLRNPQGCNNLLLHLFIHSFIYLYLFLAALGLCCCARAFSSCGERGLLFVAVRRLLIAVASLVAEHGLWARGLQ